MVVVCIDDKKESLKGLKRRRRFLKIDVTSCDSRETSGPFRKNRIFARNPGGISGDIVGETLAKDLPTGNEEFFEGIVAIISGGIPSR